VTRLRGVAAAPGVALAAAARLEPAGVTTGVARDLEGGVAEAVAQLDALAGRLRAAGRDDEADIFDAQAMLAADETLLDAARAELAGGAAPDVAIEAAGDTMAATLAALDDELLAARGADVRDVAARIARAVRGESAPRLAHRAIVIAHDLAPSVTAELDPTLLAGFALEAGSRTAHAAILARSLGIPAVVGVAGLLDLVADGAPLLVDGDAGELVLDPSAADRARADAATSARQDDLERDRAIVAQPLATSDGHRVTLGANIGKPEEAAGAVAAGAEAVGLLRTEFMFLGRSAAPDEAAQRDAYARVLAAFDGRPVVIRLLDVGGDKPLPYIRLEAEANPFLGVRAIRLVDVEPELLMVQLRAILRAAAATETDEPHLMAPMVADLADVAVLRGLVDAAVAATGVDVRPRLGIMVEVPSAVLGAAQLAAAVDFMSIGTNDLTQYLLAADRTNPRLAARQDPMHPAVLRAIAMVVAAAALHATPVAVCGEMAGDPAGAIALVGLGVDELSMDPAAFGTVKRALRRVTRDEARQLAERCLAAPDAATARRLVEDRLALPG
jgi:phosphoenolpyruvate-protein phosphotransferase